MSASSPSRLGDVEQFDIAKVVPRRNYLLGLSWLVLALLAGWLVVGFVTNERVEIGTVGSYLFAPPIMRGLLNTLILTVVSMAIAIVLGIVLAIMRMSSLAPARVVSTAYIWFFRAVPTLVLLLFFFNFALFVPKISLGIPFGPEWLSWPTNTLITPWVAAIVGLSLHEAAYMAEIFRAGLNSVDAGQTMAYRALGMKWSRGFSRIVLPQAIRYAIPPSGSEVIGMVKLTAQVSVISMTDLLFSAQQIYNQNFKVIPLLIVVAIWYLVVTSVLTVFQTRVERRFSRGVAPTRRSRTHAR